MTVSCDDFWRLKVLYSRYIVLLYSQHTPHQFQNQFNQNPSSWNTSKEHLIGKKETVMAYMQSQVWLKWALKSKLIPDMGAKAMDCSGTCLLCINTVCMLTHWFPQTCKSSNEFLSSQELIWYWLGAEVQGHDCMNWRSLFSVKM